MNSTTFNFLPDNNVVIKTYIELQSIIINPFKRCLTQSRKGAKEGKKKFLTQRHRESRGLGFRLHLVKKKILTRSLEVAKRFCFKLSWRLCVFA
ncbi:MAG: hypothetical protein COA78_16420 [Blastopirellula sp.]|nr:MAG: hypothetical protein COA78_16420 [Blastopirellula sp.]